MVGIFAVEMMVVQCSSTLIQEFAWPWIFEMTVLWWKLAAVGDVRAIKVDIPELWSQAQSGWNETARGFPIARTNGNFYVDPIDRFSFEDYPYRTTLSFNGQHWEQVEKCRPLATMGNRCLPLNSLGAVTILTWSILTADEIGYILCSDQSQRSSQFLYPAAAPASSSATPAVLQQEAVGDVGMSEPQDVPKVNPEIVAVPVRSTSSTCHTY